MAKESDQPTAPPEQRAAALELVLRRKGEMPETFVSEFTDHAEEEWITDNGARMVARAWVDPKFRSRMLADGKAAVGLKPWTACTTWAASKASAR